MDKLKEEMNAEQEKKDDEDGEDDSSLAKGVSKLSAEDADGESASKPQKKVSVRKKKQNSLDL